MTEETKTPNPNIGSDFLEFLQEQCGGKEAAARMFFKHSLRNLFRDRQSSTVTMGEILDHVENQMWMAEFRATSIIDFLKMFSRDPIAATTTEAGAVDGRTRRSAINVQERIDKLMPEFEKTPWISKSAVGTLLGLNSTPTIDKVVAEALNRGLIKKHRGRVMLYAKATETCPPPA